MNFARFGPPFLVLLALCLGAAQAQAKSCSSFIVIKKYDEAAKTIEVSHERGKQAKFFPKPEGTPADSSKIPDKCTRKVTRDTTLGVNPTGGRLSVTQIRSNFEGKMINDTEDAAWFKGEIDKLIAGETEVVAVIRPAKKRGDPGEVTTIYLPITDEEKAEIARIEAQAEDVE